MCRNGAYTERGIKDRHGYASQRYRIDPDFAVRVDPVLGEFGVLLEPTSVVAKAWDHVERIGARSAAWSPHTVLVCGAGPIGLLAALLAVCSGRPAGSSTVALRPVPPTSMASVCRAAASDSAGGVGGPTVGGMAPP
jgi:threonine dehydrogenase-like Zn-dependent dehydrogenase